MRRLDRRILLDLDVCLRLKTWGSGGSVASPQPKEVRGTSESLWDFSPSSRGSTRWELELAIGRERNGSFALSCGHPRRERSRCQRRGGLCHLPVRSAAVPSAVPNLFRELNRRKVESCSRACFEFSINLSGTVLVLGPLYSRSGRARGT